MRTPNRASYSTVRSLFRIEWVVGALLLALLIPPMLSQRPRAESAEISDRTGQAYLDYAAKRLWDDFLTDRPRAESVRARPRPSIGEYRAFLSGRGLHHPGDALVLFVLPSLRTGKTHDRIRIRLRQWLPVLSLEVAVLDHRDRATAVGDLRIRESVDRGLTLEQVAQQPDRLWSYWPLTPRPLLP